MALNVPGLIVMAGFYLVILGTGIWASLRSKREEKKCTGDGMEITLLAGRNINLLVGIFTLTGNAVAGAGGRFLMLLLTDLWFIAVFSLSISLGLFVFLFPQQPHGLVEASSLVSLRQHTTQHWVPCGLSCQCLMS